MNPVLASQLISLISILILFSRIPLGLPSILSFDCQRQHPTCMYLSPNLCRTPRPSHNLDLIQMLSLRSILILFSRIPLGLPSILSFDCQRQQPTCMYLSPNLCRMPRPSHNLDLIQMIVSGKTHTHTHTHTHTDTQKHRYARLKVSGRLRWTVPLRTTLAGG